MSAVRFTPASAVPLPLGPGECIVIASTLDVTPEVEARYVPLLSRDEMARRGRLVRELDRRRFSVARGLLRVLLSACIGVEPRAVRFHYGPRGRPALDISDDLDIADGARAPEFNVSHSGDHVVIALADARTVGVDIEVTGVSRDAEAVARRFFAPQEVEALLAVEPDARDSAFLRCWTRKEALIKAEGEGVFVALERFTVSLDEHEATLIDIDGDRDAAAAWSMFPMQLRDAWVGTLAVPVGVGNVRGVLVDAGVVLENG